MHFGNRLRPRSGAGKCQQGGSEIGGWSCTSVVCELWESIEAAQRRSKNAAWSRTKLTVEVSLRAHVNYGNQFQPRSANEQLKQSRAISCRAFRIFQRTTPPRNAVCPAEKIQRRRQKNDENVSTRLLTEKCQREQKKLRQPTAARHQKISTTTPKKSRLAALHIF